MTPTQYGHRQEKPAARVCDCGRYVSKDLGCHHCQQLRSYWHMAKRDHPELSREHCILIGSMVSGLQEAFIKEHGRGRNLTRKQLDAAVDIAAQYFKGIKYCGLENEA